MRVRETIRPRRAPPTPGTAADGDRLFQDPRDCGPPARAHGAARRTSPARGTSPRVLPRGQSGPARRPPAASRTSTAGLLGSGRHPGDKRVRPRCRGRDPGSDPPAPGRRRGLPPVRPPPLRPRPLPGARVRRSGRRGSLRARRLPALCRRHLRPPRPPTRPPVRPAARRYEYVKRLYCPPRPRPRRGPARARARRPGGGGGPVPAGGCGPGRGRPGSRRAGPQPPLPRVFPLRPAAPSLSPPPLGARRGLRAPRPPSSPPLIIIIRSTNKLC